MYKSPAIHRTPLYRVKAAYKNMLARCENKNGKNPSYESVKLKFSLDEWVSWALPIYTEFLAKNRGVPTVHRINDSGDYELSNIAILDKSENRRLQLNKRASQDNKTKVCSRCNKRKALKLFSKKSVSIDGYAYWCKECSKENYIKSRIKRGIVVRTKKIIRKTCGFCSAEFIAAKERNKFCSRSCAMKYRNKKNKISKKLDKLKKMRGIS